MRSPGGVTVRPVAVTLEWACGSGDLTPGSDVIDRGVAAVCDDGRELAWSQRYKANMAKLESGEVALVVEVIRELADVFREVQQR